jgi:hypothetical protein
LLPANAAAGIKAAAKNTNPMQNIFFILLKTIDSCILIHFRQCRQLFLQFGDEPAWHYSTIKTEVS